MKKSREATLAFLIALITIITVRRDAFHLLFFWDELGLYVPYAYTFFRNGIRFSTQWVYPILTHPPLFFWLIAGLAHLIGWGVPAFRIMTSLAGAGYISGTYVLARSRSSIRVSFLVTLALFCAPVSLSEVALAQADLLAGAFAVWTLVAIENKKWKWSAVLMGLTASANATFLAVVPAYVFGFYLLQKSKTKKLRDSIYFLIPVTLISLVWFFYSWSFVQDDPDFVSSSTKYNSIFLQGIKALVFRFGHRVIQIGVIDGRILFSLAILLTFVVGWKNRDFRFFDPVKKVIIGAVILETLFLTLFGATQQRYFMVILPGFYVLGLWCLESIAKDYKVMRLAIPPALLGVALLGVFTWQGPPNKYGELEYRSAYRDQVKTMEMAAKDLGKLPPHTLVFTHWPMTHVLKRPYLLFINKPMDVMEINYDPKTWDESAKKIATHSGPVAFVFLNSNGPEKTEVFPYLERLLKKNLNPTCEQYARSYTRIEVCGVRGYGK